MAFDLEVSITGLCVFVPDASQSHMHVLMVEPGAFHGGGAHQHPRHYPRIFYDAVHDNSRVKRRTFWRVVPLDQTVLDLSRIGGNGSKGGTLTDIPDLVDITPYVSALADPTATSLPGLICRVTLPLATKIRSPEAKGTWELRSPPRQPAILNQAAWRIVWTVGGIPGTNLPLQLEAFTGESIPTVAMAPLRPIKEKKRRVVRLFISNVVRSESGPIRGVTVPPPTGTPMPHFDAFRDFYAVAGPTTVPWPDLVYTGPLSARRGTQYSCTPSGAR